MRLGASAGPPRIVYHAAASTRVTETLHAKVGRLAARCRIEAGNGLGVTYRSSALTSRWNTAYRDGSHNSAPTVSSSSHSCNWYASPA